MTVGKKEFLSHIVYILHYCTSSLRVGVQTACVGGGWGPWGWRQLSCGLCSGRCSAERAVVSFRLTSPLSAGVYGPLLLFCRNILLFHEKYQLILNLTAATRLKKVGTGPCLPLWSIFPTFWVSWCSKCFQLDKSLDCWQVSPAPGFFYYEAMLLE